MTRRPTASLVASPVLIGAVTVLVVIIAVFLAYNANQGLPFVPTYDLKAELPGGLNLVKGNEVRVGGFRVGLVQDIRPKVVRRDGESRTIAAIDMKLDKVVEPLARDTQVRVRQRSALGLKYVEFTPGTSARAFAPGDTIPLANSREPIEFDDVFSTFDEQTRDNSRTALTGFGDAFAARGRSLNVVIEELRPFVVHLRPVMETLSDPDTELDELFKQIGRAAGQVAPVAKVQADLFVNMADTFDAFSRCPECLRQTIEKSPPTLDTAIQSFRVQRPFLADFADLSARLRPAVAEVPRAMPRLSAAFRVGEPVLPRTVGLNEDTERVFKALGDLAANPNTLLGLKDLTTTVTVTRPLIEFVAPYQVVCNSWVFFWNGIGEHLSEGSPGGTFQRTLLNDTSGEQDNRLNSSISDRPADVPPSYSGKKEKAGDGDYLQVLHGQPYAPAIDAQGNADCQNGQTGYLAGPLIPSFGRYHPEDIKPGESLADWSTRAAGGNHVTVDADTPGLAGATAKGIYKGPASLKDVP